MVDDSKRVEHNSFGMIGISNQYSNKGIPLFGSSIKHDRFICLRIKRADVTRDLHREWFFGRDDIVEVIMSASQFTNMIMSPNQGDGTPCTITYVGRKAMDPCPYFGQNEIFAEELSEDFRKAMEDADKLAKSAKEILNKKGPLKVAERKQLSGQIAHLTQHIKANMPFLHKQFTRAMDNTVHTAKAEIEHFYNSTIMRLGKKALEKLNKEKLKLPRIER